MQQYRSQHVAAGHDAGSSNSSSSSNVGDGVNSSDGGGGSGSGNAHSEKGHKVSRFVSDKRLAELKVLCKDGEDSHNLLEKVKVTKTKVRLNPSILITTNASQLHHSRQWVEVSWSNVPNPAPDDWIAVLVPAGADPAATAPAKFKLLSAGNSTYLQDGSGSAAFRLLNYRQDVEFLLMRGGFTSPVVAARSARLTVANPNEALQGRLALTGQAGQMQLQWASLNATQPVVHWGLAPGGPYPYSAAAHSFTYGQADMCGEPASTVGWVEPGLQHVAVMTGLLPGQQYYYIYGDPAWGYSSQASFLVAPTVGPQAHVKILAIADMGQAEVDGSSVGSEMVPSLNTTALLAAEGSSYSLLLHNGDLSYARGYATQWDNFLDQLQPIVCTMPYMVVQGNHERDWPNSGDIYGVLDSGGECGVSTALRFTMPNQGKDQPWYSYDHGPIHFLSYSTEQPFTPGSPQHTFITQDLQAVDRRITPWLIVNGHRPVYVSSTDNGAPDADQVVGQMQRDALEALFMQYRVDLLLHGHHHTYQRSCPVYNGSCQGYDSDGTALAPVYLVIGHAGAGLSVNLAHPDPEWLEMLFIWWGYLRMDATGTALRIEIVNDQDGSLMDAFSLTKPAGWGPSFMASQAAAVTPDTAATANSTAASINGTARSTGAGNSVVGAAAAASSGDATVNAATSNGVQAFSEQQTEQLAGSDAQASGQQQLAQLADPAKQGHKHRENGL